MCPVDAPHRPCSFLEREGLPDDRTFRFVLGEDERPVALDRAKIRDELGDRFAELVLTQAKLPRTAQDVLDALEAATAADDPLRTRQFFLVGEDSQVLDEPGAPPVARSLRFLIACGAGPMGPDIVISAFAPGVQTVELLAWDVRAGGFNFYRTVDGGTAWAFAGNSRHALAGPTRGSGPFESHVAGHLLMKELRPPWVHWHSPFAAVPPTLLEQAGLSDHPWVPQLEKFGAYPFEDVVVRPAIERWTRARFDALLDGTSAETPRRIVEQLLECQTVNLITAFQHSAALRSGTEAQLLVPETTFVDAFALHMLNDLAEETGAPGPRLATLDPVPVDGALYRQALETFDFRLVDEAAGFSRAGDTHFAFLVPERAHEDTVTVRTAIQRGVLSARLVTAMLMVDFPNPVFSARRAALLRHVPDDLPVGDAARVDEQVIGAVRLAPEAQDAASPEHELLARWDDGPEPTAAYNALLEPYYAAVAETVRTQAGFDAVMRLAEARRVETRKLPIATEFPLLMPRTSIPAAPRRMTADATVTEG